MKFVYVLAFVTLAYAVSVMADCDPNGSGEPICNSSNEGAISRNFWDPTHYWQCKNGVATQVACEDLTGFLSAAGKCVPWKEWDWTDPCAAASA
ncbi:PREDICTED: uncharacterized protein LOC108967042 [Bactrocera latifrons]|nr:PREDICTED: uncharacterized protein LOC108967042 [Bactrocera latifrons]